MIRRIASITELGPICRFMAIFRESITKMHLAIANIPGENEWQNCFALCCIEYVIHNAPWQSLVHPHAFVNTFFHEKIIYALVFCEGST